MILILIFAEALALYGLIGGTPFKPLSTSTEDVSSLVLSHWCKERGPQNFIGPIMLIVLYTGQRLYRLS